MGRIKTFSDMEKLKQFHSEESFLRKLLKDVLQANKEVDEIRRHVSEEQGIPHRLKGNLRMVIAYQVQKVFSPTQDGGVRERILQM